MTGWRLPTLGEWLFSAKAFSAAMLALYVGLWLDLPRPYWAMATAYIASQPLSGATRSKAAYRAIGTIVGASAAVALVPNLVNAPVLLSLALALWTALCLYFALLDRTPRAYTFMLAGYTAAIIGFPSVTAPDAIFATALARTEEILLGITSASLVGSLVFPSPVGPVLATRTASWLRDADQWTLQALAGQPASDAVRAGRRRLAASTVEIAGLAALLPWDTSAHRDAARLVRLLRLRMLLLLPILSSVADRVGALRADGRALPPGLPALLDAFGAWVRSAADAPPEAADRLRREIAALDPGSNARSGWHGLLLANLLTRLRELVDLRQDCRDLQRRIEAGGGRGAVRLAFQAPAGLTEARHRDHGMALLSAGAAALAVLICCAFWILAAWPDGAVAAELAAVACSFFAQQDDPAPAIDAFLRWSAVAVAVDGIYLFAVLPAVHDFPIVVLVLAPVFLLYGLLLARPSTAGAGAALAANGATLLGLQATYSADFPAFANSGIAFLVGMWTAALVTRLVRSVGAEWSAWRLLRAGWTGLADAAAGYGRGDRARFASLMLDRLGLLAPRLAAADPGSDVQGVDALAELRVGLNLVALRRGRRTLPAAAARRVEAMLDGLAEHFRLRAARRAAVIPSATLLARVDAALSAVASAPQGPGKREALQGLVGVRRGLFPTASPYAPAPEAPVVGIAA